MIAADNVTLTPPMLYLHGSIVNEEVTSLINCLTEFFSQTNVVYLADLTVSSNEWEVVKNRFGENIGKKRKDIMDKIENLEDEVTYLYSKLKRFEETNTELPDSTASPVTHNPDTARATWECVKCGTVNKANTDHCDNCKAPYSPYINPTSDPYAKKKVSRWVKFKQS